MEPILLRYSDSSEEIAKLREELAQAYEAREIATQRANASDKKIFELKEQIKMLVGTIRALTSPDTET
jgi:hypothetical protein